MVNRYFAQSPRSSRACLLILLLWIAIPGFAQESPPPEVEPGTPGAEPTAPPVLSAADITVRADEVSTKLAETQNVVSAIPPDVVAIHDVLDDLDEGLDTLLEPIGPDGYMELRQAEGETLLQKLNRMNQDLDAWREKLQARAGQLDALNQANKNDEDYFRAILDDDNVDELPDALIERIKTIVDKLGVARQQIRDQLDVRLTTLERISTNKLRISEALQAIEASKQQREREIMSFDRPPIWEMEADKEPLGARISQELRSRLVSVWEFRKANQAGFIATMILLVVIIGLTIYARPAIIRISEERAIDTAQQPLVERPVALGTLLWAIIVPEFLLPQLPLGLTVIRLLVVVAALWRLLPVIAPYAEKKSVAGLLGLTVLTGILEVFQQTDASDRLVLLFVAGTGAYFFRSFRRPLSESSARDESFWWRVGYFICAVAPTVLFACMVAVMIGAVAFAQQTVDGTLFLFTVVLAIVVAEDSLNAATRIIVDGPGQGWLRSIRRYPDLAHRRLAILTRLLMLFIFLKILPRIFPVLQIVYESIITALTFEVSMGTLNLSVGEVLGLAAGVILAVYVAKFIRFTLDEDVFPRLSIAAGKAAAASRLIYYALVAGGILFALAAGGIQLTKLTLIISALGVGIGFGLQGIVNNFVSGLVLAFERPFQIGDIIAAGTLTGRVREIGLRASRVRTFDGAEVIVPNADLIAGNVINWTLSDRTRRLDIRIGVAYGTDPRRVKEILLKVAEDSEVVTKDPEPAALFEGFGDSSLNFNLRVWIPEAGDWPTLSSDLYVAVHDALVEADIEIPFPQRTLHIRKEDI